jgi:VanZ family protein
LAPASTFSNVPTVFLVPGVDKVVHFLMYGFMVLLVRWALAERGRFKFAPWAVIGGASAYGLTMEIAQGLLVQYQRSFEWSDAAANAAGAAVFWWFTAFLFARREKAES